jgi:hypothetical protein
MLYTLGQAAKAVGRSKSSLSRAVKNGRLSAARNMDGSMAIDPAELQRVFPLNGAATVLSNGLSNEPQPPDLLGNTLIATLQQQVVDLRDRVAEQAATIRDLRSRQQLVVLPAPASSAGGSVWWRRLWRRRR